MRYIDVSNLNAREDAWVLAGLGQVGEPDDVVWATQMYMNDFLTQLGLPTVRDDGRMDAPTCGSLGWIVDQALSGALELEPAFIDWLGENADHLEAACAAIPEPWPQPVVMAPAAPPPATTPVTSAAETPFIVQTDAPPPTIEQAMQACRTVNGQTLCDCYVNEGDAGAHIQALQTELNEKLTDAGYVTIPVTGVYDKQTCGAIFVLKGTYEPVYPAVCDNPEGEWIVPLRCDGMILPDKKGGRASMFAIGGLVVAAAVAGGYALMKR